MPKATVLALFLGLLFLLAGVSQAARSHPSSPIEIRQQIVEEKQSTLTGSLQETCDGVGEDECLMRRTLNAHLDYIYTQEKPKPH